jgi:hypothetical protein
MNRLRVLRRLLVKYRASGKIDKHLYHELYHHSKGNTFKHKRALVEHVSYGMEPMAWQGTNEPCTDPQGKGREEPRAPSGGGDGCQARKDQGCPRTTTRACHCEATGPNRGRRGVERLCRCCCIWVMNWRLRHCTTCQLIQWSDSADIKRFKLSLPTPSLCGQVLILQPKFRSLYSTITSTFQILQNGDHTALTAADSFSSRSGFGLRLARQGA